MLRVGLFGHGKAGQAVARVLQADPRYDLRWIVRNTANSGRDSVGQGGIWSFDKWLQEDVARLDPVDGIVDFSAPSSIHAYSALAKTHRWTVVSAISAYTETDLACARDLADHCQVMCSPNITLGINFMMIAAKWLRNIAPFADVEIVEQHFKEKPEISGTARKLAHQLDLPDEHITSLRLGGIVGHHEIIFGFPFQTVRIVHDTIRREAFGTGAAFAMEALSDMPPGFYSFEDIILNRLREVI